MGSVGLVIVKVYEDGWFLIIDIEGYFIMEVNKGDCFSFFFVFDGYELKYWEDCVFFV